MKREEFERLKEEEKKHLREIRALKQRLKEAQRLQRIGKALQDVRSSGESEAFDESLTEVQRRAAEQEARLELAIDSAAGESPADIPEVDEEALKAARAADFIRQMKVSMGDDQSTSQPPATQPAKEAGESESSDESDEADFEKTIGRMNPREKRK